MGMLASMSNNTQMLETVVNQLTENTTFVDLAHILYPVHYNFVVARAQEYIDNDGNSTSEATRKALVDLVNASKETAVASPDNTIAIHE
jgi:hypothetical protein